MSDTLEAYERKGWQAGMRAYPDCREHYNEPFKTAYAKGYDAALEYREREEIDFYTAKARTILGD